MEPYEIIASPFEVYLAPVGTAFPDVDEAPAGNWALLGTSGKDNYSEDGVMVNHEENINKIRTLGSTGPKKAGRTEEDMIISLTLFDMSAEEYAKILNNVSVTDVPAASGTPGHRDITLRQGPDVSTLALLCKGVSPYGDSMSAQYQVPVVYQSENPSPVFKKGEPAGLSIAFTAIEDPNAATAAERFGKYVAQDADALP